MKITILTSIPNFFSGVFCSLIEKGKNNNVLEIQIIDLKNYGIGRHKKIDDTPYGGGVGMILKPDVLSNALESLNYDKNKTKIIISSPRGIKFQQKIAGNFSLLDELIIITNRYEGVDQRPIDYYNIEEISIGDYILMGGEVAATVIVEATVRLIPGILGNKESLENETNIVENYLQYDQFTRPEIWKNISIPNILKSGNHKKIKEWKKSNSAFKLQSKIKDFEDF